MLVLKINYNSTPQCGYVKCLYYCSLKVYLVYFTHNINCYSFFQLFDSKVICRALDNILTNLLRGI